MFLLCNAFLPSTVPDRSYSCILSLYLTGRQSLEQVFGVSFTFTTAKLLNSSPLALSMVKTYFLCALFPFSSSLYQFLLSKEISHSLLGSELCV